MAGARLHRPIAWGVASGLNPIGDEAWDTVRNLSRFVERADLPATHPAHHLLLIGDGVGFCLADPGRRYVVVLLGLQRGEVSLRLRPGTYSGTWYSVRTGTDVAPARFEVQVPGIQSLAPPPRYRDLAIILTRE
jgi:hypothetical protein